MIEDNVTPLEIAEIGGDALRMWHFSNREKVTQSQKAATVDKAKAPISDELDTSRPSSRATAEGVAEGPQTISTGEEGSAQGER